MTTFVFTAPDGQEYEVDGPDGSTEAEAFSVLQGQLGQTTTSRNTADELKRQGGLTARYLAEGGAGLAGIVVDPINYLVSMATGSQFEPLQQTTSRLLTGAGLPEPEGGLERIVGGASRGVAGGGGMARAAKAAAPLVSGATERVLALLAEQPGAQLVGGGGAGAGGQAAAESGGGVVSQLLASLGGGIFAPAGVRAIPAASRGIKATVEPFFEGGRENIVGSALNRFAVAPESSAAMAAAAPEIIPGSRPTTAQATRDIGLANLERGLRNDSERGPQVAARLAQQSDARAVALDAIAKDANALKAAVAEREAAVSDLYGRAKAAPIVPDAKLATLARRPSMQEAIKRASAIAAEGGGNRPGDFLHSVKMALDGMIETAPQRGITAAENTAIKSTRADYLKWLESKVPEYGKARKAYADLSRPINQLEAAQEFRRAVQNAEQTPSGTPVISQAKFFRQFTQDRAGLKDVMTPQQLELLERIAKDLDRGAFSTTGGKAVGSPTIQNLSTAHLLGRMLGGNAADNALLATLMRPLSWIMKIPNNRAVDLLYDAMLDPRLAARLMRRPTAQNVDFVNDALRAKFAAMSAGAGVGSTVLEQRQ